MLSVIVLPDWCLGLLALAMVRCDVLANRERGSVAALPRTLQRHRQGTQSVKIARDGSRYFLIAQCDQCGVRGCQIIDERLLYRTHA